VLGHAIEDMAALAWRAGASVTCSRSGVTRARSTWHRHARDRPDDPPTSLAPRPWSTGHRTRTPPCDRPLGRRA
jgi:hypothetical protein